MESQKRIYVWDNLKCLLMLSVVLGHFVNQYSDYSVMRSLTIFIYSYHMPLFIFMAGLLQKPWKEDRPFRWDKPVYYIILGYLLKIAIYLIKVSFGKNAVFSLTTDTGIPWYMFAMAAYMVLAYVLRDGNPKIWLPVTVLAALLAGYAEEINSFLYLSRIIVFFPFYYAGYLLDSERVLKFIRKKRVKQISVVVVIAGLLISFYRIKDIFSYIRIFTGRNPYAAIRVEHCGWEHRLLCYGITVVMSVAIMSLMPEKKWKPAQQVGKNTLQIYFWHRLVLYIMMYSGFSDGIKQYCGSIWMIVFLTIGVALTFVLSFDLFGRPLHKIKEIQMRFCSRKR